MPGANVSPNALYKLVVPLLRCEVSDVRDAAVLAIGNVNSEALKYVSGIFSFIQNNNYNILQRCYGRTSNLYKRRRR